MLSQEREGIDTLARLVLGRGPGPPWQTKPPSSQRTVDPFVTLCERLLQQQQADGSWKLGGQLKNPAEVSTHWTLLALASVDDPACAGGSSSARSGVGGFLVDQLSDSTRRSPPLERRHWRG